MPKTVQGPARIFVILSLLQMNIREGLRIGKTPTSGNGGVILPRNNGAQK